MVGSVRHGGGCGGKRGKEVWRGTEEALKDLQRRLGCHLSPPVAIPYPVLQLQFPLSILRA